MRGRLTVNDLRQCGCEVRHIALRHLMYAGDEETGLGERVVRIKTKFWIAKEEQDDLFQAAKVIMQLLDDKKLLAEESFSPSCAVEKGSKP